MPYFGVLEAGPPPDGGNIQGKGLGHPDKYVVPASLGNDQGLMGTIKRTIDTYAERGGQL